MWLFVVALALGVVAWNINAANASDGGVAGGAPGTTWYANSPAPDPTNPVFDNTNLSGTPIRKFVDRLPGLGPANANNGGQYIPIAAANTTTFPGSDFYRIGVVEYSEKLHPDLANPTRLRGYLDTSSRTNKPHYLGPLILARKGRPVRLLVTNSLPLSTAGGDKLFIPTDTTLMGVGMGPNPLYPGESFTQNRVVFHLHGGFTPWISDGTPHQWITPKNDPTHYKKGVSFQNVPDMVGAGKPIPVASDSDGLATYFYTNAQSGRLMFYHEHALGITRLGVYVGMAAPYLLVDSTEDGLINAGTLPNQGGGAHNYGIPLVIQDRTFVPKNVSTQDNRWVSSVPAGRGQEGDFWFPHKYEPNQNPNDITGASQFGRWDYGPWFWPPQPIAADPTNIQNTPGGSVHNLPQMPPLDPLNPSAAQPWVYDTSIVPEAFMDTMMVNGHPYPYLSVQPQAYRFRILNACNDRNISLSLFVADTGGPTSGPNTVVNATATATVANGMVTGFTGLPGGSNYTSAPGVYMYGGGGREAAAAATLTPTTVASLTVVNGGSGYSATPTVAIIGGGGSGATATATVAGGVITGFTVTGGAGYTSAPVIRITDTTGQRRGGHRRPDGHFCCCFNGN